MILAKINREMKCRQIPIIKTELTRTSLIKLQIKIQAWKISRIIMIDFTHHNKLTIYIRILWTNMMHKHRKWHWKNYKIMLVLQILKIFQKSTLCSIKTKVIIWMVQVFLHILKIINTPLFKIEMNTMLKMTT